MALAAEGAERGLWLTTLPLCWEAGMLLLAGELLVSWNWSAGIDLEGVLVSCNWKAGTVLGEGEATGFSFCFRRLLCLA